MTTTPPPMPRVERVWDEDAHMYFEPLEPKYTTWQMHERDAQWMERITSLEADRKMLWESLTQTTRLLGELVAKDAQTYAPYMRVIDAARTALGNTK